MKHKKRSFTRRFGGFTLVELLITIGIISFLIITLSIAIDISAIRRRSRDAKRINDLKKIATALEAYFNVNGKYPEDLDHCDTSKGRVDSSGNGCKDALKASIGTTWSSNPKGITLLEPKFMQEVPVDPLNTWPHVYYYEPVSKSNLTQLGTSCLGANAICSYILSAKLEDETNQARIPACNGCMTTHDYCVSGGKVLFKVDCTPGYRPE
ncbi:MAG TPA: type II secretion system protein [Patescibacteria group bacterium]|nr:type II secretion system protein [Patescibacteria group bacterium]